MDQNLRGLFERALDDEPVPPPGDLARAAMAQGTRLRRRRYLIGGTAAAVSLAVAAAGGSALADPAPPAPAAAGNCVTAVADRVLPEVSVFLRTDVTDAQRAALDFALSRDPRVLAYRYEGREAAFERFKVRWRDGSEFAASVTPDSLPESFRIELTDPTQYAAFRDDLDGLAGVQEIVGDAC